MQLNNFVKPLRLFFAFIAPLLLTAAAFAKYYWPAETWPTVSFAILLASCVGFYTNFIAIKMLFRPREPTIFGRQGLIPRKQPELATRLGEGINEHFFNAAAVREYIDQNELLPKASEGLKRYLDDLLSQPNFQQELALWLSQVIDRNTDEIHQFLVNVADRNLPKLIAENTDLAQIARQLSGYIEKQIDNGEIDLEKVVDKFSEIAAEKIPDLARWLHDQFEDYNSSQGVIKRNFVSFLKWTSDIDEESLRDQLFYLISTMEFRQAVYDFSESMAKSLKDYLETEQGKEQLANLTEELNGYLVRRVRDEGIPFLIGWLKSWLETPSAWQTIDRYLNRLVDIGTEALDNYIHSDRFNPDMEMAIGKTLKYFNIQELISQKVMRLDSQRLESLVLSATREHLSAIEVLGGILGGFAGIALFSIPTFLILLLIALGLLGIERLLTNK